MFDRAIALDAEYYGGYAGAAQALGMQALLSPPGDAERALLATAERRAFRAVALRPEASWSQSASAWVSFVSQDFDRANEISKRAVAVNPTDFEALDFDGLIALFSGQFERALQSANPARHEGRAGSRFVFRNIYAVASFHLGRYEDTIRFFNEAAEQGDPISQISVTYLAAAHYKLGNSRQAKDQVRSFQNSWPIGRIDLVLSRAFSDQKFVEEVIRPFKSAGWVPL
jgi:tetratricopeptide (TPR) repeat protein